MNRKVKDASQLVGEIRAKWGASSDESPVVARKKLSISNEDESGELEPEPQSNSELDPQTNREGEIEETSVETAPVAQFDQLVNEERKPKRNPWNDVTLFGVARFDFDGDQSKKLLSFKRGDCFLISGEAREWYRGRLVGTSKSAVGLVAATYLEANTAEELLNKYRDLSDKNAAIREEKDEFARRQLRTRDRVQKMAESMKRIEADRDRLTFEKAHLEKKLEEMESRKQEKMTEASPGFEEEPSVIIAGQKRISELEEQAQTLKDRISELELELSILGTPISIETEVPDQKETEALKKRIAILENRLAATQTRGRSGSTLRAGTVAITVGATDKNLKPVDNSQNDTSGASPEIEGTAFSNLLSSLDEGLTGKRKTVPLFGSPLSQICEAENSLVPIFVEKLCEHLLKDNAKGVRTEGIFRISARKQELDDAKKTISVGLWNIDLDSLDFVLVGDLLKTFLRELGEPLLTQDLFSRWIMASKIKSAGIQLPYVRSLLASLPPENVALIEFLCNFLVIAIGYQEDSKLTLSNAALLFAPVFLEYDPTQKQTDSNPVTSLASMLGRKTGFTPLFSRKKSNVTIASLQSEAVDIKALMVSGVAVLEMLLVNFQSIWSRFHQTAKTFTLYKAVRDSGDVGDDELSFKKGTTIGCFHRLDDIYGLGELNGTVGRFQLAHTRIVKIGDVE